MRTEGSKWGVPFVSPFPVLIRLFWRVFLRSHVLSRTGRARLMLKSFEFCSVRVCYGCIEKKRMVVRCKWMILVMDIDKNYTHIYMYIITVLFNLLNCFFNVLRGLKCSCAPLDAPPLIPTLAQVGFPLMTFSKLKYVTTKPIKRQD